MSKSLIKKQSKRLSILTVTVLFAGLNLLPLMSRSQDSTTLTLQQTIDLTIKNSHVLKAATARNDAASARLKQAIENKLPNASVSGSYLYLANPNIALKTDAFSGGSDSTGAKKSPPSVHQAMYGIVNVSLPIYAGGRIRYGIQSAKYLQQAMMLDAANDRESVILNAIDAYVNLYKAQATVNVVKENLRQSREQDSVFSRLEQNGLLARNDLLKSELHTSNVELSLLDAQSNLKTATVNMNLMIGYPETTLLKVDSTGFDENFSVKTIDQYEQMALQSRKDIAALSFRRKSATTDISLAKSDLYPTIALTGGYVAANIPHLVTITNAANIGIGLKYNISSLWKTKSKIAEAKSKETELMANEAELSDRLKLQVNQSFENFLLSQKKTEVYQKAVIQATENYRITKNKYDNSLVNTTELLDANVALLQSKINLAVAKADVLLAYSKLLETTGTLTNNQ
jgi:outer membrane protein TolC